MRLVEGEARKALSASRAAETALQQNANGRKRRWRDGCRAQRRKSTGGRESGSGVGNRGIEVDQAVDVGHAKSLLDHAVGAGNVKQAAGFFDAGEAHDDDADAGAIENGDFGQVKNQFFAIFLEQFFAFPFDGLGVVAEDNAAVHLEHVNIGFELGALNGEDHGLSWKRSRTPAS